MVDEILGTNKNRLYKCEKCTSQVSNNYSKLLALGTCVHKNIDERNIKSPNFFLECLLISSIYLLYMVWISSVQLFSKYQLYHILLLHSFFCVQGALNGGLHIPHSDKRFASYSKESKSLDAEVHRKYIQGGHVATYIKVRIQLYNEYDGFCKYLDYR